ncbi:Efflux pump [Hyphodiscus hymeniophilus]|uniref:Efflux pump n=1 Tax=Hyphodiscus hymeniophilus TaxID=353542 RepID=A0A9P6SJW1_9HELO|nr:Efflux pump [Hyphodiscus hymeniophilus]
MSNTTSLVESKDEISNSSAGAVSSELLATTMGDQKMISAEQQETSEDEKNHLPFGFKLVMIIVGLMFGVFCVALDNTIIAVAIPRITDQFHNLTDVGWYGSSYLLTTCAFQLPFGKIYSITSVKWTFLAALGLFEIGSLICAVAPSSTVLIVGRAIAGLGSAGIFTGGLLVLAHVVALEQRPIYFGLIGGVYGVASVCGPLLGGVFTDKVSWRWCFYINLPLGAITTVLVVFFLKLEPRPKAAKVSWMISVKRLDPLGNLLFLPSIICLLLALQWGGVTYAWSDGRIIGLFIVFGITLIAWGFLEVKLGDDATVPSRIASQRSIAFASLFGLGIGGSFFIYIYFIPIWFQAILGTSAVRAGIDSLPLILAEILAIVVSGGLVTKFGYYAPFFIASSVVMSIGAGLMTLFTVDISQARWVGFQFLYGIGVGFGFQQGGVAAQTVLKFADVSIGTAVVLFWQILGGAIFVSVAQNLFTNKLVKDLLALGIPGLDPVIIVHAGATNLRAVVPEAALPAVLFAYNKAILKTFQLGLILSCISILGAVGIEWRSVKAPLEKAEEVGSVEV